MAQKKHAKTKLSKIMKTFIEYIDNILEFSPWVKWSRHIRKKLKVLKQDECAAHREYC